MISLFIDTSSSDVSIAIIKDNKPLSIISKNMPNQHSTYTTKCIHDALEEAKLNAEDIDKIMIVNGPGSFTGVRIGVTIAKVYAYLLNKDIICLSSLKILALAQKHDNILSLIDARHDNYYIGLYDKDNNEIIKEQFANKDFILKLIEEYNPICVSNKEFLIDDIEVRKVDLDIPRIVDYYKEKACENCHMVVPNYLKLPQAMEKR